MITGAKLDREFMKSIRMNDNHFAWKSLSMSDVWAQFTSVTKMYNMAEGVEGGCLKVCAIPFFDAVKR
jgi:hypothetical protein